MVLHKITTFYTEWFSFCCNITSKFHTIAIYKSFVKRNNSANKSCSFIALSFICLSATLHELSP
jgi:hypothetical protein